jgi:hypothetical protein
MKTFSPSERLRSAGNTQRWTALIAVASIGCLPLFSVLADQNNNHGNKGGGNKAPSSHQGGPHPGAVNKAPNAHPGGNHTVNTPHPGGNHIAGTPQAGGNHSASNPHPGGNHIVSTPHSSGNHTVSTPKADISHQKGNNGGVNKTVVSHQGNGARHVANKTVTSHETAIRGSEATRKEHAPLSNSQVRNVSPDLGQGASSNADASLYQKNNKPAREGRNQQAVANQQRNAGVVNRPRSGARETIAYNHSLRATSVHSMMSQRLTQISSRRWTEHGTVFSTNSDPQRGYWYHRDAYWWRCNFWGARSYCTGLIDFGRPPGLCWAWYDNICWGNVVIGMPLELVTYYYPDAAYTSDTSYDGEDATVYYYPTDDGQYKQVTVVDGEVVDIEIVDQLPS